MKQYRDDLLASCLTMILSLPKEIITEEMMEVVPAIQVCIPQLYRYVYHSYTGMYTTAIQVCIPQLYRYVCHSYTGRYTTVIQVYIPQLYRYIYHSYTGIYTNMYTTAIQVCMPQLYRYVYHSYTSMYATAIQVGIPPIGRRQFLHFVCPVDSIVYCIYSFFSSRNKIIQ